MHVLNDRLEYCLKLWVKLTILGGNKDGGTGSMLRLVYVQEEMYKLASLRE